MLLLPGPEDEAIWQYFATSSMPEQAKATAVLDELDHEGGALSTVALEARVDIRRSRLELLLKVLDVDGAVERVQGGWRSTGVPWVYDAERYDRIAAARRNEQRAMLEYETTPACRMEFLQRALDDPAAAPLRPVRQLHVGRGTPRHRGDHDRHGGRRPEPGRRARRAPRAVAERHEPARARRAGQHRRRTSASSPAARSRA